MKTVTYKGPSDRLRTHYDKIPYLYRDKPADLPNDVAEKLGKRKNVKVAESKQGEES